MSSDTTISRLCPACGSGETSADKIYNEYRLLRGAICALVFTQQRHFSADQYDDVYSNITAYQNMLQDAHLTFQGEKGFRELWWFKRKALKWITSKAFGKCLLDIGSGPGTFLMVAHKTFGYEIQGVELASIAASAANKYGVPTFCGTIDNFAADRSRKFDVITLFEVLEHLSDPLKVLIIARELLSKEGLLVISVPNLDDPYCLLQQIDVAMPPVHINFFCRKSLGRLLDRAGFSLERNFTLPVPSSSVRNIYGREGFLVRLPYLAAMRLLGRVDGTTLLAMAKPIDHPSAAD